jgi:hypothetical protein
MSMFSCYFGLGEDDQEEGEEAVLLERRDDDNDTPLRIQSVTGKLSKVEVEIVGSCSSSSSRSVSTFAEVSALLSTASFLFRFVSRISASDFCWFTFSASIFSFANRRAYALCRFAISSIRFGFRHND